MLWGCAILRRWMACGFLGFFQTKSYMILPRSASIFSTDTISKWKPLTLYYWYLAVAPAELDKNTLTEKLWFVETIVSRQWCHHLPPINRWQNWSVRLSKGQCSNSISADRNIRFCHECYGITASYSGYPTGNAGIIERRKIGYFYCYL